MSRDIKIEETQAGGKDINKLWGQFPFTPSKMRPHQEFLKIW